MKIDYDFNVHVLDSTILFPNINATEILKHVYKFRDKNMCGKIICSHAKFKTMQMVLIENYVTIFNGEYIAC